MEFERVSPESVGVPSAAVQALLEGQRNVMIGIHNDHIVNIPFAKAIKKAKPLDEELLTVLRVLSI